MPTGYTAKIGEGATFDEFVWECARAFGALILMRDEPMGAKIPLEFQPSDWNKKRLEEARRELSEIKSMPEQEASTRAKMDYQQAVEWREKSMRDNADLAAKYNAILAKVQAWEPPTTDHQGLKDFMVQQITESIEFDCSYVPSVPVLQSGAEWKAARIEKLERDIAYHAGEYEKEVERTQGRSAWVQALHASIPMPKSLRP